MNIDAATFGFPQIGFHPAEKHRPWLPVIDSHQAALTRWLEAQAEQGSSSSLDERPLAKALAECKRQLSRISMHLPTGWFGAFNRQLDLLVDEAEWDDGDLPPKPQSFATLLRMLLVLRPDRRPGLGASSRGLMIAMWTVGPDKFTVECLPNDVVRWWIVRTVDGATEKGAGETQITRLAQVIAPYAPATWLADAE
jgi:hypothetical protein